MKNKPYQSHEILGKAAERAANALGLSNEQLVRVLGESLKSASGHGNSARNRAGERALMLIRIYQALHNLCGADEGQMKHWMQTENRQFDATPISQIHSSKGLIIVLNYLETLCNKH